jgi:hypothetical protein
MRALAISVAVVLVAAVGVGVYAQSKPSFAGKWTIVPDPNAQGGRGRGGMGLGQEFVVTQDDKTMTTVSNNPQMGEIKAVYNLDGTETKNPLSFGGQSVDRVSKVKWDGAKLVITTTSNFNGNAVESTQTWALDGSGNLVIESTSNFGGNQTSTKSTYKKG